MRIALVSDAIYPYHKGGKETRLFELSTRLSDVGHDVHIYTMKWWPQAGNTRIENGVTLHAISKKYDLYRGERRSITEGIMFGLACFGLLKQKFDVADVDHMPYFPLFSMWVVCLIKRRPMIATWHEVWGGEYWRTYLGRMGWLPAWMERMSVHLPASIVAVSPFTADRLSRILNASKPVSPIVNGIDWQAISRLKPSHETSDLVFVGRLLAHKNVDLLIKSVAILTVKKPTIKCVIISDGPERRNLETLAAKLGVSANIIFKGFVETDTEKLQLMKASKVFVLPSTREGFGIVALEALACGLKVVTVDHPENAARHLVGPGVGRLCQATVEDLTKAIELELDAVNVGKSVEAAKTYDWDISTRGLMEVYAK